MRFKRPVIALLILALVALGALAFRATITADAARNEVENGLSALFHAPLRLEADATPRLLPWPGVLFERVTLTRIDDGRVLARMDGLDVALDVAALLLGRVRPEEVRLVHPDIRLDNLATRLDAPAVAALLTGWRPITVVVEKGRLSVALANGDETFESIDARLAWPRPSANLQLRTGFRWRGEAAGFDLECPSPTRLLDGESGSASLRLTSAPVRLTLAGTGALLMPFRFEGTGDLEIVDAARFARWTGWPRTPDLLAGRLRIDGRLAAEPRGITLSTTRLDLAGNRAEGALSLRWDGLRPRLSGTLAFADLDLSSPHRRPWGQGWRTLALDRAGRTLDLDLRLSATTVKTADLALTRVGAALHAAEGHLRADIGSAEAYGKPVTVALRGDLTDDGIEARVRAGAEDLPLAEIADLLAVPGVDGGRLSAGLDGTLRCTTLGACAAATEGRLRLEGRAVRVTGASPFADITRFRPIVPQSNGATVSTTWDGVLVDMHLAGSRADVVGLEILGQGARFFFTGRGDLVTGGLDLTGHAFFPAFRPDPARNGTSEISVPMRIGGTLQRLEATARDAAPPTENPPAASPAP